MSFMTIRTNSLASLTGAVGNSQRKRGCLKVEVGIGRIAILPKTENHRFDKLSRGGSPTLVVTCSYIEVEQ